MTRMQSFERQYPISASAVLSSIAKVARAGRTGDQAKIRNEQDRHHQLMASLPETIA
jgi:hypothetical protein